MLSAFGKAMRQLRIDRGWRLLDVATAMKVSSAYLSAIETGRKTIPDGFVVQLSRALPLTASEVKALRRAADQTRKEVRVDALPGAQRELLAAFARNFDDVPDDMIVQLRDRLGLKSNGDDIPFYRKRRGIVVNPRSRAALQDFAEKVRTIFADEDDVAFPIVNVLEFGLAKVFPDFVLDIREVDEMEGTEGCVFGQTLVLREDVYEGAARNAGRDRFTCCHELAHFLMHREVTLPRVRGDDVPIFRDSEWQADTFAGSLMMSSRHLERFSSPEHAAQLCGMSLSAARVQFASYRKA